MKIFCQLRLTKYLGHYTLDLSSKLDQKGGDEMQESNLIENKVRYWRKKSVREQDICDKEIKNKKELCYNASDQTNKITGDPSYETYYNRRTETS